MQISGWGHQFDVQGYMARDESIGGRKEEAGDDEFSYGPVGFEMLGGCLMKITS